MRPFERGPNGRWNGEEVVSAREDLVEGLGEGDGSAGLTVFVTEEPAMAAREGDDGGAEPLGDRLGAAMGHLALRLDARAEHDPGRRRAERREVRLVVRAGRDVLEQQWVGPGAVVLGRHPEHRRIGRRLGRELEGHRALVADRRR